GLWAVAGERRARNHGYGDYAMKRLAIILMLMGAALPGAATTYYACGDGNLNDSNRWGTTSTGSATCGGSYLTWGSQGLNDTFDVNGATVLVNVDPSTAVTALTGTVSFTYGSTAVTGSGTNFAGQVTAGDTIYLGSAPPAIV